MNSADLELAIACLAALAWLVQTALADPVEAVIVLGLLYLASHLTQRLRSRRGGLAPR
jgi:hypothetical protein